MAGQRAGRATGLEALLTLLELVQIVHSDSESPGPVCLLAPPSPRPEPTDQPVSERLLPSSFGPFALVLWLLFASGPWLGCWAGVDVALPFVSLRFGFFDVQG